MAAPYSVSLQKIINDNSYEVLFRPNRLRIFIFPLRMLTDRGLFLQVLKTTSTRKEYRYSVLPKSDTWAVYRKKTEVCALTGFSKLIRRLFSLQEIFLPEKIFWNLLKNIPYRL